MNKHLHRIIFNPARGLRMVVQETATSAGKANGATRSPRAPGVAQPGSASNARLAQLALAVLCLLGAPLVLAPAAQAQIVADPTAPGNQRPTVLAAPNGVPLVNIQTPSAAGVSRNTYSQFDVNAPGAILNNARSNAATQLGGWVQGNPWLATGSARVILNEVNSSNPSQLRGFVEVAGQRADVIIANPAGVNIDGAGFVNASRATVTTGTASVSGGALDGFVVQRGLVSINGAGLDARQTDYTSILARAVQVNGQIQANELKVITGANQIDLAQTRAAPLAGSGAAPAFALDASALGGMYAGKITLIGTEAGLGVRNSGVIGASAGDLVVQTNGWLNNSASIQATGNVQIDSASSISNSASGSIYANGNTRLSAGASITNAGLVAAQGNTSLQASSAGAQISASKGSVIAAGLNADGTLAAAGNLSVASSGTASLHGQSVAGGHVGISGTQLSVADGQLSGQAITLAATTGHVDASRAGLSTPGALAISAAQTLRTDGATVSANQLIWDAHDLSNLGGEIVQAGTGETTVAVAGTIDNTAGRIAVNSQSLTLSASTLTNTDGRIEHAGAGALALSANTFNGQRGQITGNGALSITADSINHQNAQTLARQITVTAGDLNNQQGEIAQTGSGQTTLGVRRTFDNSAGVIASNGSASISAQTLDNTLGRITSAQSADVTATAGLNNSDGTIAAGLNLSLTSGSSATIDNTRGVVQSRAGNATLNVGNLINNAGSVYAGGSLSTAAADVTSTGSLYAAGSQTLTASGAVSNTGVIAAQGNTTITAGSLSSTSASLLGSGIASDGGLGRAGHLRVSTTGALAAHGQNLAAGDATLSGASLDLSSSQTSASAISLTATAGNVNTSDATLTTPGMLHVSAKAQSAQTLDNRSGTLSAGELTLDVASLNNARGQIIQTGSGNARLSALGAIDNTAGVIASNGPAHVSGQSLSNQGGTIQATGASSLSLVVTAGLDNSSAGKLAAGGDLDLVAGALNNTQGSITAGGSLGAALTQGLDNGQGLVAANGDVSLAGASLGNSRGTIASVQGSATLRSTGATQNDSGNIQAALDLTLVNTGLSNAMALGAAQAGRITAGTNASILTDGQALNNAQGTIAAGQRASVQTGALNNDSGLIQAAAALSLNTSGQTLSNANASQHASGAGGITSQGTLALATGDVNNAQGFVGAKGALTAAAANIDNSAGGQIVGQSSVSISSTGFDNRGGQLQALGSLGIDAGAGSIDNSAGLMRSAESLSLSAATVINSNTLGADQGIEAKNIAITASGVANNQGAIRADNHAVLTSSGRIDNTAGLLSAGNTAVLQDLAATKTLAISNTAGTLIAGQSAMINAASLSGDGKVLSRGDVSMALLSDFNNSGEVTANRHASITTPGNLTNSGKLQAGNTLTLDAQNIDNAATGDITGAVTQINAAQTLTNRGLIDGQDTRINAGTLSNLGTGRIYGDHLSIAAVSVNNDFENGRAGTIAARERLDIGAQTIDNREHALIFSAGDMAIGGKLDASRFADGQASRVNNASATIESLGSLAIDAAALRNSNEHFTTQMELVSGPVSALYIQPQGNPVKAAVSNFVWENWSRAGQYRYVTSPAAGTQTILGSTAIARVGEQNCTGAEPDEICTRVPGADYLPSNPAWSYFALTPPAIEPLKPALALPVAPDPVGANTCTAGAGYNANACTAYNNDLNKFNSDKTAYDTAWAAYDASQIAWTADTDAKYGQLDAAIETYNNGFAGAQIRIWTQYNVTRTESQSKVLTSDPGKILSGGSMSLRGADLVNDKSQIIAGATLSGDLVNLRNLQAQGQHVVHEEGTSQYTYDRWRGGFKRYYQRDWDPALAYAPADEVTTIDLPVTIKLDNTAHARQAPAINAAITANTSETAASSGPVSALVKTASLSTNGLTINAPATVAGGGAINPAPAPQAPLVMQATLANPTGGAQIVRAVPVNSSVPNTSLYQINPAASAGYLIETDPRFASYRQWLGSDYLLQAMSYDPVTVQKRLGDGFYEQKLIREQVAQLTGRRFLDGYASDEEQFQALMDAGLTYAKAHQLRPGIALSAAQMAQLTSDIVWLVEQTVTLADGAQQQVLVPQLYARLQEGDLGGTGALLAGKEVNLQLSGDLTNSGTIAGRRVVSLTAENVNNLGGRIKADAVAVQAREDLNNIGGSISANSQLIATAGRDLNVISTTQSDSKVAGLSSFSRTHIDRVAGLYVTNPGGTLVASAGRDASVIAGVISNTGQQSSMVIAAGRDLNLGSVQLVVQENNVRNSTNYLRQGTSEDIGSQVQAAGSLRLQSGNDLNAKAATIEAAGALRAAAGNNINLTAGQSRQSFDEGRQRTHKGVLASKTISTRDQLERSDSLGSSLGGNTVTVIAGNDIKVSGSSVISDAATVLVAKNNLTIEAAQTSRDSASFRDEKTSGLFSGGGIGVTYGVKQQSLDSQAANTAAAASTVGSIGGNVTLMAGNQYRQVGSDVVAPGGDISILAKKVDITEARETSRTATEQKFSQSGLTLAITSPVLSALQTVQSMSQAASQTSSARMQGLALANSALAARSAVSAVQAGQGSTLNGKPGQMPVTNDKGEVTGSRDATAAEQAGGINLSISIGGSKSQSNTLSQSSSARGSSVAAGGNVRISATGAGEGSNLTVQGSRISAGGDATLMADNRINLLAASNDASQKSSNKSSSGSIGASLGTSGFGVTVSASAARGKSDGQDVTYRNTRIEAGNTLRLQSGGDTTLKGAAVAGKTVQADIGGNLSIESLQDTSAYASKQASLGGSLTVGAGVSGSVSASSSKSSGNFASVAEQSGMRAGDGGFAVNVKGNTDLRGGVIASTDQAIADNKNRLSTGTLTTSDLQNKSEASASSSGINLSSDMLSQGKYGAVKAVAGNALNGASESGSASGQTRSAVSAGAVTITDESAQQAKTGKTGQETVASLNRDTANAQTAAVKQDAQAMQQTVEAERVIKQEAVKIVTTFTDETYRSRFQEKPKFFKVECPAGANCVAEPSKLSRSPATPQEVAANASPDMVMAVNGIFNDEKRAMELAYQNAANVDKTDQNPDGNKPTTIYLMHVKPAQNSISELMGVGYEKAINSMDYGAANFFGYTNAAETYAGALSSREDRATNSLGHSRGTLVQESSLTILGNRLQSDGSTYTNPNLTVRGVGGAADAQSYTEAAVKITGEKARDSINYSYFSNDPVSTSKFSGGNPGVWTLKDLWQVYDTSNSMHSCYGTGGNGCAQVETPVRNGPQGTLEGNARLIQFKGGQQVDRDGNPITGAK